MQSPENALTRPISWCTIFEHNTKMNSHKARLLTCVLFPLIPCLATAVIKCLPRWKMWHFYRPFTHNLLADYVSSDPDRPVPILKWCFSVASVFMSLCVITVTLQVVSILDWNYCGPARMTMPTYAFVWAAFALMCAQTTFAAFVAWIFLLKVLIRPGYIDSPRRSDSEMGLRERKEDSLSAPESDDLRGPGGNNIKGTAGKRHGKQRKNGARSERKRPREYDARAEDEDGQEEYSTANDGERSLKSSKQHHSGEEAHEIGRTVEV